ncbi:hypothetical protein [Burkholderia sp. BCC0419]|uniref:hypothetical protein n=1 Tax=Burkholderia sp. BCC0419 TaxID=486878 RepID=UPI0015899F3A|nr:hypothetical protein [Burkholderia sp. BCC0419]
MLRTVRDMHRAYLALHRTGRRQGIAAVTFEASAESSDQVRRVRRRSTRGSVPTEKQEQSAMPNLGAERKVGSHPPSRSSAVRIAGSVTVDHISGRWMPATFVPIVGPIALFAPNRFIIGRPHAKRFGEPPSASRVSHLRVVKRARALRINP